MIAFINNKKIILLIETFLQSLIGPLADTSSYVDWLSLQLSPITPIWPVQSSEGSETYWHSAPSVEVTTRHRRPGCLSIEGERADPSETMTYPEADPEADMQSIYFLPQACFF